MRPVCVVHDALFEQRGADAHDDRAVDLAFGQPRVDDQAAILHGDVAVDLHDAGFGVDRDVRDLHAAAPPCCRPIAVARLVGARLGDLGRCRASCRPRPRSCSCWECP